MNIKDLIQVVITGYKIKRPVLALGAPGLGKTSSIFQAASKLSAEFNQTLNVITVRAATSNPAELSDLKAVINGKVIDLPQDWVPTDEKVKEGKCAERGIVLLDEVADSTPTVQSALQQLLLDRRLGSAKLAKGWGTVAASNRVTDKAAAGRISTALVNRCITVQVEPDTDCFVDWALDNNINPAIVAFMRWRPTAWNFDPSSKSANPAFCSPRSMHILSDILNADPNPHYEMITGTIGDGPGSELSGFLRIMNELPDLKKLIKEADTYPVPEKMDVAIATLYALMSRVTEKNIGQILKYFTRNQIELAVTGLKDLVKRDPRIGLYDEMRKWMQDPRNVKLLTMM